MRVLSLGLLLTLAGSVQAEIYQYTDANGQKVYTSMPPKGQAVEQVELGTLNTLQSRTPSPPPSQQTKTSPTTQTYSQIQLTGVSAGGVIRANNGSFGVGVSLSPALQPEHRVRFLLDGQPVQGASRSTGIQLLNIDRGTHSLQVEIIGAGGQVVQRSNSLTFTLQRSSLLSPPRAP